MTRCLEETIKSYYWTWEISAGLSSVLAARSDYLWFFEIESLAGLSAARTPQDLFSRLERDHLSQVKPLWSDARRKACWTLLCRKRRGVCGLAPLWRPFLTVTSCCPFPSSWSGGSTRGSPCSSGGRCGVCCSTFPKSRRRRKTSTRYGVGISA